MAEGRAAAVSAEISAETRDQLEDLLTRLAAAGPTDLGELLALRREAAAILPHVRRATPPPVHREHPVWVAGFVGVVLYTDPECPACHARGDW